MAIAPGVCTGRERGHGDPEARRRGASGTARDASGSGRRRSRRRYPSARRMRTGRPSSARERARRGAAPRGGLGGRGHRRAALRVCDGRRARPVVTRPVDATKMPRIFVDQKIFAAPEDFPGEIDASRVHRVRFDAPKSARLGPCAGTKEPCRPSRIHFPRTRPAPEGTMAKGNAKKRAEDNVARLARCRAILFAVGAHFLVRLVVYRGTTTWWVHWPLSPSRRASSWFCYASLRNVGAPTWDASGALVDGGGDLTLGGMSSYYHDIIYISVFCLVAAALVSDWIWLALLSIPAFATYKLWADRSCPGSSRPPRTRRRRTRA